ncbi:hypothetical protein PIB30_075967, partial [Stylosanthes scabra]|nr:hypothetical protein [Stylosanthes scabra]
NFLYGHRFNTCLVSEVPVHQEEEKWTGAPKGPKPLDLHVVNRSSGSGERCRGVSRLDCAKGPLFFSFYFIPVNFSKLPRWSPLAFPLPRFVSRVLAYCIPDITWCFSLFLPVNQLVPRAWLLAQGMIRFTWSPKYKLLIPKDPRDCSSAGLGFASGAAEVDIVGYPSVQFIILGYKAAISW